MSRTPMMDKLVLRTTDRHLPFSVHLDLTYRCNERCVHCYLDHEDYGEMNTAEMKSVLDQLAAAGTLFLTLSGGEIFLRQDFFDLLEHARKLHFDISLKTNALLITPARAQRLKSLGVRKIQVSIYSGDPAIHDGITLVPGSLERSLEAIRYVKSQGMVVTLACPLMKQNLGAFRSVIALAEEMNVPYVMDMTITPMIDGNHKTVDHRVALSDLLPVLSDAKLNPKIGIAPTLSAGDSAVSSGMPLPEGGDDICCSAGHNTCYISPYGEVFPCVQLPVGTGNVRTQKFEDIWYHSPEMERISSIREAQLAHCGTCSIRPYCERCPGLALMEGGDIMGAYQRACELAEMNARLAGVPNPISALHAHQASTGASNAQVFHPAQTKLVAIAPLRTN
jgi:radical SAM protein with 4Fe4S-binding SPASM domain